MPKDLHSLIRLHDWRVDEKQRALADLLGAVAALEARVRQLEEELLHERTIAAELPDEAGLYFGRFATAVIDRRKELDKAIDEVEEQIAEARDNLREAYRELKKYELAQASRDALEAAERNRREQIQLDEIGIQTHLRNKKQAAEL